MAYYQNPRPFKDIIAIALGGHLIKIHRFYHDHLHVEVAYFLCVNNAHHWKKHHRNQGGHCQRQEFKNPENVQNDLTEI